jgi:hypothetical protein
MATDKQIAANRLNAQKSTGPRTLAGRQRSRRNAVRHGLTAETVVLAFESADEYAAFEKTIVADYEPQTTVEHQLVARIASLFWRLRRAAAIETGLLQIQGQMLRDRIAETRPAAELDPLRVFRNLLMPGHSTSAHAYRIQRLNMDGPVAADQSVTVNDSEPLLDAARSFLRLGNLDGSILDLIIRYEASLSRQLVQTMHCLAHCRRGLRLRFHY